MKPVILLIDLQNDFLQSPSLEPAAGQVVERATRLLDGGRALSIPIIHVWTTVDPKDDRRMPHWKMTGKWACVEGTEGHATPEPLRPVGSEKVVHKTFFSPFGDGRLDLALKSLEVDTLLFAGVHLHGCVRTAVLDAYHRGFRVWVAEDAVASDDPLHAAITQRYLQKRAAQFMSVESFLSSIDQDNRSPMQDEKPPPFLPPEIVADVAVHNPELEHMVHVSPRQNEERLWAVPICAEEQVSQATAAARHAWLTWRAYPIPSRVQILKRLARLLETESHALVKQMAIEIGKPVTQGQAEVTRTVALLNAVMRHAADPLEASCGTDSVMRFRSVGVISIVTPWNNPLAIPLGKIGPALFYGNTVVWKPAPAGSSLAVKVMELLRLAGCPAGVANLVNGDRSTALALMASPHVDAVTFSGSLAAGYWAQDICARRHVPLQAELGGNNAAIIWRDCDLEEAAFQVAEAAFGFAGQRCTANRRVIVDAHCYDAFLKYLETAVASLVWDDPLNDRTQVGPLISSDARSRVAALVERAKPAVETVLIPHRVGSNYADLSRKGAYFPPTIICCDDAAHEIVQEETFGPLLVVQRACDWSQAMHLCNGVKQGLVAALFSGSKELQKRFLYQAQAGVLKINRATADANAEAPFGGWKASGIGPPEHGPSNREFYTRTQTIYHVPALMGTKHEPTLDKGGENA